MSKLEIETEEVTNRKKNLSEASTQLIYPRAKKAKILVDGGIDSSMGASFSDALVMCSATNNKKHKKSQKLHVRSKPIDQTCDPKEISNKPNTMPDALKVLPQNKLDIQLNSPLSTSVLKTTDNYKPAPINQNVTNCIYPSTSAEKTSLLNGDAQIETEEVTNRKKNVSEASTQLIYPRAKKAKILVDGGIDSSMGASFSDALVMCSATNNKKHKKSQKLHVRSKPIDQTCDPKEISNKPNTMPDALKVLPQNKLDIQLNSPLSTSVLKTTDNYKPAPINQNVTNCIYPSTSAEKTSLLNGDAQIETEEVTNRKKNLSEASTQLIYPRAKKAKILVDGGIDSSMGASFSDALVMCSATNNKKHKKSQKLHVRSKPIDQTCDPKEISNKPNTMPDALKVLPQNKLDIQLNSPLSASVLKTTDNYKPAPINQNVTNCIYPSTSAEKTSLLNGDALNVGISSKTMRTKVYSGVKTSAVLIVPSLFDICIRVLQKNFDALEYTGGVPFDVLRPVLERTTPQQLLSFEDYNAYLLEDTDVLWQLHVKRHFRGEIKQDGETWREMFLRCEDEKERRLSILTNNIKISQKQSTLPVRKTRLAYVDNVVKPPRNVQCKQEQFGTNDKLTASPAARVAALSSVSHNAVKAGDPRLKISRDLVKSTGNNQIRSKKAPLMAKTLQFIKKQYKR